MKKDFYSTWKEASKVAMEAGVKSGIEYLNRHKALDLRLPSDPYRFYSDFPGWIVFLDIGFYATWQEASKVAIEAGIKGAEDYKKRYKTLNPRLPSNPRGVYQDFPGWKVFLDKSFYSTWQEASKIAIEAGIRSGRKYKERYKTLDFHLPSCPDRIYSDFPGWIVFLGKDKKREKEDFYLTWQEASKVVIKAGVEGRSDYKECYKSIDSKLPFYPSIFYSDFPGWKIFLARGR